MKRLSLLIVIGGLISSLAGTSAAASWVPVSCDDRADEIRALREQVGHSPDFHAAWQRYEQEVRAAEPGDPKYVPRPYPHSPQEVFEDFRYAFLSRLVTDPLNVAERHRETYDALQSGDFHYEVARVENWNLSRCKASFPVPFYHLVRIFDGQGRELSRAALYDNGIFAIFARLDGEQGPLDDLSAMESTVSQRFGVETKPTRAQHVVVSGMPVLCSAVMPCVAFRSGGKIFLVDHDFFLFAIEPGAPSLSVRELAERPVDPRAASVNAGRASTPWISVGYGSREGRLVAIGPRGGPLE